MTIQHVKEQDYGYLVTWDSGRVVSVPSSHAWAADVQAWIDTGNTPEPIETAAERTKRLRAYINTKRNAVEQGGFTFNTWRFNSDVISVARITGTMATITAGNALPADFQWTDADDVDRALDASNFAQLHGSLVMHASAAHRVSRELKASLEAGNITSEAEIDAAGWPANA